MVRFDTNWCIIYYMGGVPERWHRGCDLHYCHAAVHTHVIAVKIATNVTSVVVKVENLSTRSFRRDGDVRDRARTGESTALFPKIAIRARARDGAKNIVYIV